MSTVASTELDDDLGVEAYGFQSYKNLLELLSLMLLISRAGCIERNVVMESYVCIDLSCHPVAIPLCKTFWLEHFLGILLDLYVRCFAVKGLFKRSILLSSPLPGSIIHALYRFRPLL